MDNCGFVTGLMQEVGDSAPPRDEASDVEPLSQNHDAVSLGSTEGTALCRRNGIASLRSTIAENRDEVWRLEKRTSVCCHTRPKAGGKISTVELAGLETWDGGRLIETTLKLGDNRVVVGTNR